jgi:hypothetical protein
MREDSPFAYQTGDNRWSGWIRWALERGYPIWTVPVAFLVLTVGLFGLTMLCLALWLPRSDVPTLTADIEKLPGVASAQITSHGDRVLVYDDTVIVRLKTGAEVTNPRALVGYLLRVGWAASGGEPEQVVIRVEGGHSINVPLAAAEAGCNEALGEDRTAIVDAAELRRVLGAYPEKTPPAPRASITVHA